MSRGEEGPVAALAGTSIADNPGNGQRPLHILVAEDNEFNRELPEHLPGHRGHSVAVAKDGREALAMLGSEALIVSDLPLAPAGIHFGSGGSGSMGRQG
jgi:CheY-like chemotaxis protein